jgi:hypothetical protein
MSSARANHPHEATPVGSASEGAHPRSPDVRVPVSACLIVQDEERRLPDCLASLAFCEEIVVVDGGSHDRTVEIARAGGAKVLTRPWAGYAAQRNFALDQAGQDWVLEIDADERVSDPLRAEIEGFVASGGEGVDIAAIPLRHMFLGRSLGPSALYPMYRHRLFRRGSHRHDERRSVHEGLVPDGPTHAFVGDLEHRLADDWGEALRDCLGYARLQASSLTPPAGARAYLTGIVLRPAAKVLWRVIAFAGWRDGWQGLVHIGLGGASDSLIWMRLALARLRRRGADGLHDAGGRRGADGRHDADGLERGPHDGHFGRRIRRGPARIVAIADSPAALRRAEAWLALARAQGADVALIAPEGACIERGLTGCPPPLTNDGSVTHRLHIRFVSRLAPLFTIRALEAEQQIRPIDALIGFGDGAQRLLTRRSRLLRASSVVLGEASTPEQAIELGLAERP